MEDVVLCAMRQGTCRASSWRYSTTPHRKERLLNLGEISSTPKTGLPGADSPTVSSIQVGQHECAHDG